MDGAGQFSRDNHFVPRFYLKRWANDGIRVCVYRLLVQHANVPEWKNFSVKGFGYHEHLYTRALLSGESDDVERWLAREFEDPATESIDKLMNGRRMQRVDWHRVIRFLAAQDVRTPARMLEVLARSSRTLPEVMESTLKESVQKLKAAHDSGQPLSLPQSDAARNFPARVTTEIEEHAREGKLKVEAVVGRGLSVEIAAFPRSG